MDIERNGDSKYTVKLGYWNFENYSEVVEILSSNPMNDSANQQRLQTLITPVVNDMLSEIGVTPNEDGSIGMNIGMYVDKNDIIVLEMSIMNGSNLKDIISERLFSNIMSNIMSGNIKEADALFREMNKLGEIDNIGDKLGELASDMFTEDELMEVLSGNVVDSDAVVEESEVQMEVPEEVSEDSQEASGVEYYIFDSMTSAIDFSKFAESLDKKVSVCGSVLYKAIDTKSPVLKGKYIMEVRSKIGSKNELLSEFSVLTHEEVGFSASVIEHCEVVIGSDAMDKLAKC